MQLAPRLIAGSIAAVALAASGAQAAAPSISGFWRMQAPVKTPKPALTAEARAAMAKVKLDPPDIDKELATRCVKQGMPHVMDSAGPIDIIQGASEILISAEKGAVFRHIYTDRRKHISEELFDHTVVGDSIGLLKAGVLDVDTVGFVKAVGPFGAPLTERTHLVERFKVSGDKLSITSTWTDKATFAKPFTYTLAYDRLPADYTVDNIYCDPRDNGFIPPGDKR